MKDLSDKIYSSAYNTVYNSVDCSLVQMAGGSVRNSVWNDLRERIRHSVGVNSLVRAGIYERLKKGGDSRGKRLRDSLNEVYVSRIILAYGKEPGMGFVMGSVRRLSAFLRKRFRN